MKHTNKKGFTLVELAIVLVIIGLIIGGVLAGQDLIKAATIKSQLTQIEQIDQGVTTFQTKYSGLPGDLLNVKAAQYSLTTGNGTSGSGDGNGVVEGFGGAGSTISAGETGLFFNQLSDSKLIAGSYAKTGDATSTTVTAITASPANFSTYFPKLKLRDSGAMYVYPDNGRNQIALTKLETSNVGVVTVGKTLSPAEAKAIDEKKDDAAPWTGNVVQITALGTIASAADDCATSATAYKLAAADADKVECILRVRPQF